MIHSLGSAYASRSSVERQSERSNDQQQVSQMITALASLLQHDPDNILPSLLEGGSQISRPNPQMVRSPPRDPPREQPVSDQEPLLRLLSNILDLQKGNSLTETRQQEKQRTRKRKNKNHDSTPSQTIRDIQNELQKRLAQRAVKGSAEVGALPRRPTSLQSQTVAIVEFKRGRVGQYLCDIPCDIGDYLIVRDELGDDCGMLIVVAVMPYFVSAFNGTPSRVMRKASDEEVEYACQTLIQLETRTVEFCQATADHEGVDIHVVDAEYQFDRKKLTFFYSSAEKINLRDFTKRLTDYFNTKVLMVKAE